MFRITLAKAATAITLSFTGAVTAGTFTQPAHAATVNVISPASVTAARTLCTTKTVKSVSRYASGEVRAETRVTKTCGATKYEHVIENAAYASGETMAEQRWETVRAGRVVWEYQPRYAAYASGEHVWTYLHVNGCKHETIRHAIYASGTVRDSDTVAWTC